ncbi:MAG TPA: hypothetical protein VHC19_04175 [Pirellulales bacterium]|jgi:hypothetical protein|nr:hypothetical protein [Pirellulales bacterium]
MKRSLFLVLAACFSGVVQSGGSSTNDWFAAQANAAGWQARGGQGTARGSSFGAAYGYGAPYNRYGNAFGYGVPYFGFGGGYMGGGYGGGYGGGGYRGLGGYGYGMGYANFDGYGPNGVDSRFYYGAPAGNGGFGYGPGGYGNNDTSTYRYRGTSALPQVPPFSNYAQPSTLIPYSYIYANTRTPQSAANPETVANPFVNAGGAAPKTPAKAE